MYFRKQVQQFILRENIKTRNIILFGLPGAGKGTYGSVLARNFNFLKVSPGDLIRKLLKDNNPKNDSLKRQLKEKVDKGLLVDDDLVFRVVDSELAFEASKYKGLIFDGIPRTLSQLQSMKVKYPLSHSLLINVVLREDILIEKLGGRRVCNGCGRNYNICSINKDGYQMEPLLPKKADTCDDCSGTLILRNDDKIDVIANRIAVYKKETQPLMDELRKLTEVSIDFEPKRGVKDYPLLEKLINEKWKHD